MSALGLDVVGEIAGDEQQLFERIYQDRAKRHEGRFVDDQFVNISACVIWSDNVEDHHGLIAGIQDRLRLHDVPWLSKLQREPDLTTRSFGIRGLAALCDTFYGDAVSGYAEALNDPRKEIREAVLKSIARLGCLEFLPVLEAAARSETDPDIKASSSDLIDGLRRFGKRGMDRMW